MKQKRYKTIKFRLYLFVICIILLLSILASIITYIAITNKTNKIYKTTVMDNSKNFAASIDGDFIREYKQIIRSDEYQKIRQEAEDAEDESIIENYLKEQNVWDKCYQIRSSIDAYLNNISGIKYLYLVDYQEDNMINIDKDMYLLDSSDTELYMIGYYEEREKEFLGKDIAYLDEPVISNGDWGWLYSYYSPVFDSNKNIVCLVGCDIDMSDTIKDRRVFMTFFIIVLLTASSIIFIGAISIVNKLLVNPLRIISTKTKEFKADDSDTILTINNIKNNEIGDIYASIRIMQTNIINYIKDINTLYEITAEAEQEIVNRDEQIQKLNIKTYKDVLTGVGNYRSYKKKAKTLTTNYSIVMIDINNLKQINDSFGHEAGDIYIKNCCNLVCDTFKHSPVYRIGGDEFVVILQGTDYENRQSLVKDIIMNFDYAYNQVDKSLNERYSASVGVADWTENDTIDTVFKKADQAMYNNKEKFKKLYGAYR